MMKIPRFEVVDMDWKKSNRMGIKDHSIDKIVVIVNRIADRETTLSIAEGIISVIETHLGDDDGGED